MLATESSKPTAVEKVIDGLIDSIIREDLAPGDKLPTEPELAQLYGVGRNSVREAIKQLQGFGILYIKRADGTYIADHFNRKMLDPLLYSLILQKRDWQDLVELRAVIDIGTLHVALDNPDVTRIVPYLRSLVERIGEEMRKPAPDVDTVLEMDLLFHTAITETIHNPQVDSVTNYIARLTIPSRRKTVQRWLETAQVDTFLALHSQIVDVIEQRDIAKIEQVVHAHYVNWRNADT